MNKSAQRLFEYVLLGVLGLLPIVIIIQIVVYIEGLLRGTVLSIYGRYENWLIPVILFAIAIALVIYIGYLLKQDKAYMLYFVEKLIHRIPFLGSIYRMSQKLLSLFRDDDESQIRNVVFIEYPKPGLWVPAYVTNRVGDMLVIYVPTSPNPTSGFTILVDESKTVPCNLSIEEASSYVISLGADLPHPEEVLRVLSHAPSALSQK